MTSKNVRTATLRKYIEDGSLRLSKNDRDFLQDLSKVHIIDERDANQYHYSDKKTGAARRLEKLCSAGVLDKVVVNQPGRGQFKAYQFKTDRIATLFGGKRPVIGRKRNALHEVITSKIYFAEGRPDSFVVESEFTSKERELFRLSAPSLTDRQSALPDALYYDANGAITVVEADSGQYNKTQILSKQLSWTGFRQIWGQPAKASARVSDAKVHLFS